MNSNEILMRFLWADIAIAEALDKLPAPPKVPSFAKITVRPGKKES